jgi:hypothetical protein
MPNNMRTSRRTLFQGAFMAAGFGQGQQLAQQTPTTREQGGRKALATKPPQPIVETTAGKSAATA